MERVITLEEKKETIRKEALNIKKTLIDEIKTIVMGWGVACFEDAQICHIDICEGFRDNVEIRFEISFIDNDGNHVWASDVSFDYDSSTKLLSMNHGTCGRYNKNDTYQFRRIQLINKIITNINFIEARLQDVCDKASETYIKKVWEGYEVDVEIAAIKASIKKTELDKITHSLAVGQKYQYREESPTSLRLYRYSHKPITITKITPKLIFFTANPESGTEYRCKKEAFINHIYNDYLTLVD